MNAKQRVILIFTCFTIVIVFIINLSEYYFINQRAFDDFYKRLEIRAISAGKARFAEDELSKSAYDQIRKEHLETLKDENEYFVMLRWEGDKLVSDTEVVNSTFIQTAINTGQARYRVGDYFYLGQLYEDHHYGGEKINYVTVLSARNDFLDDYLNNLSSIFVISCLLTVGMSLVLGVFFSRLVLKPVKEMSKRMKDISANKLHLRLGDSNGKKDEMSLMADTFNDMLDRLEIAFESQKNFISNASHEFNTPLTSIIGEAEYALAKSRNEDTYREVITAIHGQAERLKNITASLFQIAQTGYDGERQPFVTVRVDEVLYTAKAAAERIHPESDIYVDVGLMPDNTKLLKVDGNEELLEVAFVNIIINACKYSDYKPVKIVLAASTKDVIVIIEDNGVGIPEDELKYIYDPFFRASNTTTYKGYGIGLPLTRNIIKLHGGTMNVYSKQNEGTRVKITMPVKKLL